MATTEPKNKEEFSNLMESIAADVLLSLQESLVDIEDAPSPESIESLDWDRYDFVGVFGSSSGRFVFRMDDRNLLYQPYTPTKPQENFAEYSLDDVAIAFQEYDTTGVFSFAAKRSGGGRGRKKDGVDTAVNRAKRSTDAPTRERKPKNCKPTSIACGFTCLPSKTRSGKPTICRQDQQNLEKQKATKDEIAKEAGLGTTPDTTPVQPKTETPKRDRLNKKNDTTTKGRSQPRSQNRSVFAFEQGSARNADRTTTEINEALSFAKQKREEDPITYEDNELILDLIDTEHSSKPSSFRAVRDQNGVIQSMAILKTRKNSIEVDLLATAPWNVREGDSRYTRGAGTAMMSQIIQESFRKKKNGRVSLVALPRAIPFYQKIGFVDRGAAGEENRIMELTPEAAQNFLVSQGIEFAESSTSEADRLFEELADLEIEANGALAIKPGH